MIKIVINLFLCFKLYSDSLYTTDYKQEINLLEALDIESSFLYDKRMNTIFSKNRTEYQDDFLYSIDKAYIYIPAIKNILAKNNVPKEFVYLAMVESHFSSLTISNKEAVGIWQFIPETAKDYHLRMDKYVDERQDIVKSTQAAVNFLKALYKKFGKWYLVVIAYNCGAGRLEKAINSAGSNDLTILLDDRKHYIPRESRRYIRKLVAYILMGNDYFFLLKREYEHFFNISNTYSLSTVKLPVGESLSRVSKIIGLPLKKLKDLNRHLKYEFTPPYLINYDIYIPYEKLTTFKREYFQKSSYCKYEIYNVQKDDTLKKISELYNISYVKLVIFNKLSNSNIFENQQLIIPIK